MANDKKQDGLFHWNFDLQDTDSDFTDIDYSTDAISVPPAEDEIKPMIFVDGSYKSDSHAYASPKAYDDEETEDYRNYKRKSPRKSGVMGRFGSRDKDARVDYYEDRERFSGNKPNIPWKPIIIGGAILALAVLGLILLLAGRDTRKKVWAINEDKEIAQLVDNYFKAKTDGNATAMKSILVPEEKVNSVQMALDAKAYEGYSDIRIYSYPGMKKTDTALFVAYNSKFQNIDTKLPTIAWFYAKPDSDKILRLMPLVYDKEKETQSQEYQYTLSTYEGSQVQQVADEAKAAYQKAVNGDAELEKYLKQIAAGNYEPYVPETTTLPPTTEPTTTPAESTPSPSFSGDVGHTTEDGIRFRSTPDTSNNDNVIAVFEAGHMLEIIEEIDGWFHVRDVLTTNQNGGTQTATWQEGYVSSSYFAR